MGKGGCPGYRLVPFQDPCVIPQVIQGCGNPKVNPQGPEPEEKRRRGKLALPEKPPTGTLQKLVSGPSAGQAPGGRGWGVQGRLGRGARWPDCCPAGL